MKTNFFHVSYALAYAELLANVQSVDTFKNCIRVLFLEPVTQEQISDLKSWPDMEVVFSPGYDREVTFRDATVPQSVERNASGNSEPEGAD